MCAERQQNSVVVDPFDERIERIVAELRNEDFILSSHVEVGVNFRNFKNVYAGSESGGNENELCSVKLLHRGTNRVFKGDI